MTRREFFSGSLAAALARAASRPRLLVPVHIVQDSAAKLGPRVLRYFWWTLWPEAVRDFGYCGIVMESTFQQAEIWRPPGRQPMIGGLQAGALNLVITNRIPMEWDSGRALAGVTTLYRGFHVCMIAMDHAHGHQIPFLSTNTCVHEMLHALMHDIFENRPRGLAGQLREYRIDAYATRLWLFHDGAEIRRQAVDYVARLEKSKSALAGASSVEGSAR